MHAVKIGSRKQIMLWSLLLSISFVLPILPCSCRKSVARSQYSLEMCIIQVAGNPSVPRLFDWHNVHTNNLTYPDLPVAWPDAQRLASVKKRPDIGLILFPEQTVPMGKAKTNVECQVSGKFFIKGEMMKPVAGGTTRVTIKTRLNEVTNGSARLSLHSDGVATMEHATAGVDGTATYPLSHEVDLLLPLDRWVVCRYLDFDGYKPLTLRLVAYRMSLIER